MLFAYVQASIVRILGYSFEYKIKFPGATR